MAGLPLIRPTCGGAISLVIWAVTLVVGAEVPRARAPRRQRGRRRGLRRRLLHRYKRKGLASVLTALMLAAGLLFGDGVITPAISVLSAVEGLKVATPLFERLVVPITLVIITGLFAIQYQGTTRVGSLFGPVIAVWFVAIGCLGARQVLLHPEILTCLDPTYGLAFLHHAGFRPSLLVLGAVMLAVTGGEALYADMGHFGRRPIQLGWFTLVYPALLLNYLGQGAFLLGGEAIVEGNVFYSLVPRALLYPAVILATAASIIASQALISGAYSLTSQAMALGLFPRLRIVHTHQAHGGQIYAPFINWSLYVGCVLLVIAISIE